MTNSFCAPIDIQGSELAIIKGKFPLLTNVEGDILLFNPNGQQDTFIIAGGETSRKMTKIEFAPTVTNEHDEDTNDNEDITENESKTHEQDEALRHVQNYLSMFFKRKYVIIDVGGERFQADRKTFLKFPNTRLGRLMSCKTIEDILKICEEFIPGGEFSKMNSVVRI